MSTYTLTTRINNLEQLTDDIYTRGQTDIKILELIAGAPDSLNTLYERSKAINDDPLFYQKKQNTIVNSPSILSTGSNTLSVFAPSQGRYRIKCFAKCNYLVSLVYHKLSCLESNIL